LLNDLRDVGGDRRHSVYSIPVIFGEAAARKIGFGLVLAAVSLMVFVNPVPFVLTGAYSGWLVWHYQRQYDQRWRIWIEGQGIFAGLVAILIQPLRY
jgi:4-hydroxybenzoate polyprenyltransferase